MKSYITFLSAIVLVTSCRQSNNQVIQNKELKQNSDQHFYKRFEGTIAEQKIVLQLFKNENTYSGTYYYRNTGGWLTLSADSVFADSVLFYENAEAYNENTDGDVQPSYWRCKIQNESLTGIWTNTLKKISYQINLKEVYPEGSYKFFVENYADSLKAFPGKPESPMAEINYSFVIPEDNNWLSAEIKKIINYDNSLSFKDGFSKIKTEYFTDYKKELPANSDSLDMPETYNYSFSKNMFVRYNENNFLILELAEYSYSGGVHGNYGSNFYCYDVAGKKQLGLSDIISADSVSLQHIIEKYFKIQYKVKSNSLNEVLFENYLAANQNFYFNEKGISFLYNPYEVASYAQGEISVTIPFSALKIFLQPSFKKRMNITF